MTYIFSFELYITISIIICNKIIHFIKVIRIQELAGNRTELILKWQDSDTEMIHFSSLRFSTKRKKREEKNKDLQSEVGYYDVYYVYYI